MARTGKIARLPKSLRDQVNLALRDGATASRVIELLTAAKAGGATNGDGSEIDLPNDQNITNWREGGYAEWCKEQERLDDMRIKREFAMDVVKQNEGGKIHEAGLNLAASQIFEVLQDFDIAALKERLAEDPENFIGVVRALSGITKEAREFEKYREFVAERKREIEAAIADGTSKGGITPETLAKIRNELNLL